ncbi:hypothetical protein LOTGIDRAFT_125047, partial [Lottia gigantea]
QVEVLTGSDKGKIGTISRIYDDTNLCIVKGLNLKFKLEEEAIDCEEKPLLVTSEVALIDPAEQTKTDVEWRYTADGERVRVSLKSGRIIPLSATYNNTEYDGVDKAAYKDSEKDTPDKELRNVTYIPKLSTFEEDIMQEMGIVETRVRQKKYWY